MTYWYKFEIVYWEDNTKKYEKGAVIAEDYETALERLISWYSEPDKNGDDIQEIKIKQHDCFDCAIITKDELE